MIPALNELAILPLIGWTSGISLYLTIGIVGIAGRFGWVDLPGGLDGLQHPVVIAIAVLAYAVEFVADKVPLVDSAWDTAHTFIRPVGAGIVGALAGTEYGPVAATALAVLTGAIALDAHALKATSRLAINTSPEPFSNIAASVAEDSGVIFLFWFFIKHPWITLGIVAVLIVLSVLIVKALWAFAARLFSGKPKPPPAAANP